MGCSPPVEWYEQQDRAYFAKQKRQHRQRVDQLIKDIDEMDEADKRRLRNALES